MAEIYLQKVYTAEWAEARYYISVRDVTNPTTLLLTEFEMEKLFERYQEQKKLDPLGTKTAKKKNP